MRIGTLIVDDQEDVRALLRVFIEMADDGLYVSGEAATGQQAIDKIDTLNPSVVVLDQMMPGMDGLETAAKILEMRPHQTILLCSAHLDDDVRRKAERVGIKECIPKMRLEEIPELVRLAVAS